MPVNRGCVFTLGVLARTLDEGRTMASTTPAKLLGWLGKRKESRQPSQILRAAAVPGARTGEGEYRAPDPHAQGGSSTGGPRRNLFRALDGTCAGAEMAGPAP